MGAIAEIAVLDIVLLDTGAVDRMMDGVGCERHRRRDVEPAAAGLRQACARIGNDDGFTHCFLPFRTIGTERAGAIGTQSLAVAGEIKRGAAPTKTPPSPEGGVCSAGRNI